MERGMFIVLEGADGSGKTTQFNLLSERLQAVGYEVAVFDFPRYGEPSSHFIQTYLNGGYGPASQVSPYTASLFYALDRYESKSAITEALDSGKIVLSNRFVGSNMAHQGSKFTNLAERRGFFIWEDSLEFELLGIPRPDLNIFLHVPAEISYELVGKKNARSYTDKKHDEHEGDINHLLQTVETYEQLCKLFPKDFKLVECAKENKILSIPQINDRIWEVIKPVLPKPKNRPQKRMVNLNTPEPERQPTKNHRITLLPLANQNELLKVNLKTLSLLETRRVLKHLTVSSEIAIPKRVNTQSLFVPIELNAKLTKKYRALQEAILSNYQKIAKDVGVELAQAVLPLSYLVDIHVKGNSSQWLNLHLDLCEYPDNETEQLVPSLTRQLGKRWPSTFKKPCSPYVSNVKPSELQDKLVGQSNDLNFVSLINASPRNELDILVDAMYTSSDFSRGEISASLDSLLYQQKADRLTDYLGVNSVERETLLGKISYELDLITSGIELLSLLSLDIFSNVQIQPSTPRFGYGVPDKIDEAGISDAYLDCFDTSLNLYSELQSAGYQYEAQYAVLLGNRVRWHGVLDARGFIKLKQITNGVTNELEVIIKSIEDGIVEAHPVISSILDTMSGPPAIPKKSRSGATKQRNQSSNNKRKR
jgi:dTMP kinase